MITFYFSGTGNSRFVAQRFSEAAAGPCYSIEESLDFDLLIAGQDTIAFCYPVYGSSVPRPMREFVKAHAETLRGKQFVILATQLIFSGDGAHALCAELPGGEAGVVYAEHIRMPNNLCNFPLFPVKNGSAIRNRIKRAGAKAEHAAEEVLRGVIRLRGFHKISIWLGKSQSAFWPQIEQQAAADVRVSADCIRCGICVRDCPTKNLSMGESCVNQAGNCVVCYRCVNACPKQAITTLIHQKPVRQYRGIPDDLLEK